MKKDVQTMGEAWNWIDQGSPEFQWNTICECLNGWNSSLNLIMAELVEHNEMQKDAFMREARGKIGHGVKQIIFTGAPGTGKTRTAMRIAGYMGAPLPEEKKAYTFVQFHPSYDYTDFVEGLRPVQTGSEGNVSFFKLDGQFKAFCRKVVEANERDTENKTYFFIIDEINRAELSKVFGELMFCLDKDKRGPGNRVQTQYHNLPTYDVKQGGFLTKGKKDVFEEGFYIPENVVIIGTMNDIDRSVESMDFALRRRFDFMEAVVDREMLKNAFGHIFARIMEENESTELAESVVSLNEAIQKEGKPYGLNRQYFISQGQFTGLPEDPDIAGVEGVKQYVWKNRLDPLLREYLRGEAEESIDAFLESCRGAFGLAPDNDKA